jgi:hypothetical protein
MLIVYMDHILTYVEIQHLSLLCKLFKEVHLYKPASRGQYGIDCYVVGIGFNKDLIRSDSGGIVRQLICQSHLSYLSEMRLFVNDCASVYKQYVMFIVSTIRSAEALSKDAQAMAAAKASIESIVQKYLEASSARNAPALGRWSSLQKEGLDEQLLL